MINITNIRAKRLYQAEFDRQMSILENTFFNEVKPLLGRQFYNAADLVSHGVLMDGINHAVDLGRRRWVILFEKHYRRVAGTFSKKTYNIIDRAQKSYELFEQPSLYLEWQREFKGPKDEFWNAIQSWSKVNIAKSIRDIQFNTKKNIGGIIKRGMQEGESHRDIAKRIRKTSAAINPHRANVIARTETHKVAVKSVDVAVASTRIEMEREWISAKDARTRTRGKNNRWEHFLKFPAGADGEKVPQDGKFVGTGETLAYPGDPAGSAGNTILCRCVIIYHTVKVQDSLKPHEPIDPESSPMTSIGNLSNCIVGSQKSICDIYEAKKKPVQCNDYIRSGGKWFYKGEEIIDEAELKRIKAMGLPPAWKNVTASRNPLAKVQAIGMDRAGRWQYKYSAEHIEASGRKKFDRVKLFSKEMPNIRKGYEEGIKNNDARAFLLRLEDKTAIRAGSTTDFRAKKKAYGLTTLQNEHVQIKGNKIILDFVAKEGIPAHYEIEDKILAGWLKNRKESTKAGEMLFSDVSATKLNDYIKKLSNGKKYTIKDFRTYHGTRIAFEELRQYAGVELSIKEKKQIVKAVSEKASDFLKNTPVMARNSYIDPMVWDFIGGLP